MQVEAARRGGEHLAHPVRCKRDVGRLGMVADRSWPSPAGLSVELYQDPINHDTVTVRCDRMGIL